MLRELHARKSNWCEFKYFKKDFPSDLTSSWTKIKIFSKWLILYPNVCWKLEWDKICYFSDSGELLVPKVWFILWTKRIWMYMKFWAPNFVYIRIADFNVNIVNIIFRCVLSWNHDYGRIVYCNCINFDFNSKTKLLILRTKCV